MYIDRTRRTSQRRFQTKTYGECMTLFFMSYENARRRDSIPFIKQKKGYKKYKTTPPTTVAKLHSTDMDIH